MSSSPRIMFIFPGQGSQYQGIGSDIHQNFACARAVYEQASTVLGYDIAELSFQGPDEKITLTRYTQPILLTHHIACLEVFKELSGGQIQPTMTAGHSLGEYSALVAAGALSFTGALKLVQKRGEFMGEYGAGEMLALPLTLEEAQSLAEKHYCAVAGCNLKDQTVVGGLPDDLDSLAAEVSERYPKKRPVRLKTEGAFHTYYMVTAAQQFRAELDQIDFNLDRIQVLSNYTGDFHTTDAAAVRTRLFFQLFHPVLWLKCLETAFTSGIDQVIEFGGGIGNGTTPAEKRPNLESMIKKAQRGTEFAVAYQAAINLETLTAAAQTGQ
jgi:[acyl-carrier-protein] S-malonyltransferase